MKATKQKLAALALVTGTPCVTLSLNTHQTRPDSERDRILLKNLLKEAESRVVTEFGSKETGSLLGRMSSLVDRVDFSHNLKSLHIFLSNQTEEIVRSIWPVSNNAVHISSNFALRPLIKAATRDEEYCILLLSQGGALLFQALNDTITDEITDGGFPFPETPYIIADAERASDPKQVDNMVREYFNKVDKGLVEIHHKMGLKCVVVSTEDNYSRLMQVADKPGVYLGYAAIDYNNTVPQHFGKQCWEVVQSIQQQRRALAIEEMIAAITSGNVLTDLQEIYRAAIDGRGDLLIVHTDFFQPVRMKDDRNFDLATDNEIPGGITDIISDISWAVLSKNGRVEYTRQEKLGKLGKVVLKTRY